MGLRPQAAPALAALLASAACVNAPVLRPAGAPRFTAERVAEFGGNAREIECRVSADTALRGVFVPAADARGVVLHLLGSQACATSALEAEGLDFDVAPLTRAFADAGYASLVVDWRGVGASDGRADARHLGEDAWAAWRAALREAGGNPADVVLRATSIASLAAGELLEGGIRPRAVVLIAPVLADTVCLRWLRRRWWAPLAECVALFVREPSSVDLERALNECASPVLVLAGESDELTSADERARIRSALGERGQFVRVDGDHLRAVHAGYALGERERSFLRDVAPSRLSR